MSHNTPFNSFYIVSETLHNEFYEYIEQHEIISCEIKKKSQENPLYLDFLRDAWFVFYKHPKNLIYDPMRAIYLLIRKNILNKIVTEPKINWLLPITENNKEKSFKYATLLCEVSSLYFKQNYTNDSFKKNIDLITSFYYSSDGYEKNYITNGQAKPKYTSAQVEIIHEMDRNDDSGESAIGKLFNTYRKKQLSQLEIFKINTNSVMTIIKPHSIATKETSPFN